MLEVKNLKVCYGQALLLMEKMFQIMKAISVLKMALPTFLRGE